MPWKRSTYTAEFKLAAIRMITDQKLAVAEVARRLDVGENLLRARKKAFEERGGAAFPGQGNPTPADDDLRRLRAENVGLVVGWSMAETMESRLVVAALPMAVARRLPLQGSSSPGLLAHSDRGSQYASDHYRRVLAEAGTTCSSSGVGQCWDNAPVESFLGRLKCELDVEVFATRDQARAVFEYLEVFYNRVRRHSSLGFLSPAEFERTCNQTHR